MSTFSEFDEMRSSVKSRQKKTNPNPDDNIFLKLIEQMLYEEKCRER